MLHSRRGRGTQVMHRETRRSGSAGGWRENSRRARVLKSKRRKSWAGGEVPIFQGGHHLRASASTWITTEARAERGREPRARHVTRLAPTQLHTPVPRVPRGVHLRSTVKGAGSAGTEVWTREQGTGHRQRGAGPTAPLPRSWQSQLCSGNQLHEYHSSHLGNDSA